MIEHRYVVKSDLGWISGGENPDPVIIVGSAESMEERMFSIGQRSVETHTGMLMFQEWG